MENIRKGNFPSWDLKWQTMELEEQEDYDFDPLDATKVSLFSKHSQTPAARCHAALCPGRVSLSFRPTLTADLAGLRLRWPCAV